MENRAAHFKYILAKKAEGIGVEKMITSLVHRQNTREEIVLVEGWWLHADLIREVYADEEHYYKLIEHIEANSHEEVSFSPPSESFIRNFPKKIADELRAEVALRAQKKT